MFNETSKNVLKIQYLKKTSGSTNHQGTVWDVMGIQPNEVLLGIFALSDVYIRVHSG